MVQFILNPFTGLLDAVGTSSSGSGIETINDISPDSGGNFTLTAGTNITLVPGTNSITIDASGSGSSTEGASLFVVDSQGNAGYTTIQDAITAAAMIADATTPQTVWVWPGTYEEDLTLQPWVNLASAALGVIINGSATFTPSADGQLIALNHLTFNGVSGDCITVAGTQQCTVILNLCILNGTGGNCLTTTNSSSDANIYEYSCVFSCSSGNQIYDISGAGSGSATTVYAFSCISTSSGNSSTIMGANEIFLNSCQMVDEFTLSSSAFMLVNSCFLTSIGNPGSAAVFTLDATSNIYVFNTSVSTTGTYWITGTGTLFYNAVSPANFASKINTTITTSSEPAFQTQGVSFDGGATTPLNTVSQCTANQVVLGTGGSALNVVSGTGTSLQVLTSNGSGADPTWEDAATGLGEGVSEFVVDSQGSQGYTTISAAITAAALVATSTTPQTVWVWPGTYTENVTFADYVNVASAAASGVLIIGNASYTGVNANSIISLQNLSFQDPGSGDTFTIGGSSTAIINFNNCFFNAVSSYGLVSTNNNNNPNAFNCAFVTTTGTGNFNFDAGGINLYACIGQGGTSTISSAGGLTAVAYATNESFINDMGFLIFTGCNVAGGNITSSGAANYCLNCEFQVGGYWITGTGNITYSNITTGAQIDPAMTQMGLGSQSGNISFDGGITKVTTSSGGLVTQPPDSHTATTAFNATIIPDTSYQNTTGYDLILNLGVAVTAATSATVSLGVGPTSTPTADLIVPTFTTVDPRAFVMTAYVPNNYYVLIATTGTISGSAILTQAMAV